MQTGMRMPCATTCAPTSSSTWEKPTGCWYSMKRASSRKARSRRGWRGNTAARPGGARTVRSASFCCMPPAREPALWTASCTCPRNGRSIGCAVGKRAFPTRGGLRGIGELAQRMLARAFAAEVPAKWVVGDTVYGYDEMRSWLEKQRRNYVLAGPETHLIWIAGQPQPVGLVAALLPEEAWVVLSAGEGSQGPRLYEWAWLELPEEREPGSDRGAWMLIRRSLVDASKRAYYRAVGPPGTRLA